jgi:hypothetical protein
MAVRQAQHSCNAATVPTALWVCSAVMYVHSAVECAGHKRCDTRAKSFAVEAIVTERSLVLTTFVTQPFDAVQALSSPPYASSATASSVNGH